MGPTAVEEEDGAHSPGGFQRSRQAILNNIDVFQAANDAFEEPWPNPYRDERWKAVLADLRYVLMTLFPARDVVVSGYTLGDALRSINALLERILGAIKEPECFNKLGVLRSKRLRRSMEQRVNELRRDLVHLRR